MRVVPDDELPAWLARYREQSRRETGEPAPAADSRYEELLRRLRQVARQPLTRPGEPR